MKSIKISWFFQILAAIILLQTLYFKFGGHPDSIHIFSTLGMEPWGRIGSGIVELIAGILLLNGRTAWIGAGIALGVMIGAISFHLTALGISVNNDGGALFGMALVTFIAAAIVLFIRRRQIPFIAFAL